MDDYIAEVIAKKAAEIRREIKAGTLFGMKIDEADQDMMLMAAYSMGLARGLRNSSSTLRYADASLIVAIS